MTSFTFTSLKRFLSTSLYILGFTGLLFLAHCADDTPPETFPAPNYDYLPQLNLNISHIRVTDQTLAGLDPKSLEAKDPTSPNAALALMARQRLNATGNNGMGYFTITDVHFHQTDERTLSGHFAIKLSLNNGNHKGAITAQVNRESTRQEGVTLRHHLFTLTQQMMDDMNVELEYQIHKNLDSWLTDATGMPLNSTIQTQSLAPSSDLPSSETTPSPHINPSSPTHNEAFNTNSDNGSHQHHSPPPTTLHLP